jgi:hypothetical protein
MVALDVLPPRRGVLDSQSWPRRQLGVQLRLELPTKFMLQPARVLARHAAS